MIACASINLRDNLENKFIEEEENDAHSKIIILVVG